MRRQKAGRVVLSLDIGSDSIKMIKGRKSAGKIWVLDFAYRRFPVFQSTPDLVSQRIYELLTSVVEAKKIKKLRIHSTISGRKLCIRVVKLPLMPEAELYQALRSKIRKFVSPDLEEVRFSFSVLGEIEEMGIKKLEVVFIAMQKTFFDEYRQFFQLAGAQPKVITSACFSGWNLIRQTGLDKDVASLMLINIEAQETDLTVYRKQRFVFTRNISIGGRDFSDTLKGQTQLSLDSEAEHLSKEIELTAHHYYQITHGEGIDKCIILGEGSRLGGLVDFLKQKLEISTEALHIPETGLEFASDKREEFNRSLPLYTQALGALLTGPDDINLLAKMRPQAKGGIHPVKFFAQPKMTAVAIVVFISLGLIIFIFLKGFNLYYQQQIKSYKIRRDKLQNRVVQLMQIKRKMDILDFEKGLYLRLVKEHPAYPVIIAEICQAIPSQKIVLDELEFSRDSRFRSARTLPPIKFTIAGKELGKDATGSEATRFVLALEQSGYFENISVTIKDEASPGALAFRRGFAERRQSPATKTGQLSFVIDGLIRQKK